MISSRKSDYYQTFSLIFFQGFVMSTFFFGYIITQIAGGILADRYGGDRMLFYSAFVWSICTFLIPVIGDVFHMPYTMSIIVLRALSGVAQGKFLMDNLCSLRIFQMKDAINFSISIHLIFYITYITTVVQFH